MGRFFGQQNRRWCCRFIPALTVYMETPEYDVCGGARWVCEAHPDKPWDGESDREDACHCGGAGMPCPVCNRTVGKERPEMPPGFRTMIDTDGPKH